MRSPQLHTTRQWTSFPASSASTGIPGHSAVFAAFCDVVAASGGSEGALVSGPRARARTVNIHISLPHPQSTSQCPASSLAQQARCWAEHAGIQAVCKV